MSIHYAFEKLSLACAYAITSEETVQTRLASAIAGHVIHLQRDDFPTEDLWERVTRLRHATTCKPAEGEEGTIAATTAQMTTDEAVTLLHEIFSIFSEVAQECGRQDRANSAHA
jgi:hypothetical protein